MSAHLSVSGEEQFSRSRVRVAPRKPTLTTRADSVTTGQLRLAGMVGAVVVIGILGLCAYVVVQYLL